MRLFANIVTAIRRDGIARLIRIRHRARRFGPVSTSKTDRGMSVKPLNVRRTGVALASVAKLVLAQQLEAERGKPRIVKPRCAHPLGAGMIDVTGLVAALRRAYSDGCRVRKSPVDHPVARIQQLARFEEHLDHVLVAVPAGALAGIRMKKEDVHVGKKGGKG